MRKEEPKYLGIVEWIQNQIEMGTFGIGDRMPSENEIGMRFGLSRQTVRQATSILESEGILERRRGSGTYVASICMQPKLKAKNIGVIAAYLDDYIFPKIIRGIDEVLIENAYTMQLGITYNKAENETHILSAMLESGVAGLIIEPTKSGLPNLNADLYEEIQRRALPCIFINGYYQEFPFPYLAMDDSGCGKAAAAYLLKMNHRRIGAVFKSDDIQGHMRYAGLAKELRQSGVSLSDERVLWYMTEDLQSGLASEFEARVLQRFRDCTAAVCSNDQIAIRVLEILTRHGMVIPRDLSLIGFDDLEGENIMQFGLTTFSHPKEALGRTAASNLLRLLHGERFDAAWKFAPRFIERTSVRRMPNE